MKVLLRFVKATLVGGFLFMVPLVLLLMVLGRAIEFAKKIAVPIVKQLPVSSIGGVAIATLAAAALLLLIALVAGLVAQTAAGRRFRKWLEDTIVGRVPVYSIIKGMVGGVAGLDEGASAPRPALAWVEECWVYAFIMEVHADGYRTVFVPGAPSPMSGAIYFLPDDRVRQLDVPLAEILKTIRRLGLGSADLLKGRLGPKS